MNALKCKADKEHSFSGATPLRVALCPECGVSAQAYMEARKKQKQVSEAIKVLADSVNSQDTELVSEAIVEQLTSTHPTLQQCLMKSLKKALLLYSEHPGTDGRNEAAKKWAHEASESEIMFPFI